jgi:peptidoglycan hydrolase-like protein with peptidoglycan-binding domain
VVAFGTVQRGGLLSQGSTGADVRRLQQFLVGQGARIEVDGHFGPRTAGAVRDFQRRQALAVDGVVGPDTAGAIARATRGPSPSPAGDTFEVRPGERGPEVVRLKKALRDAGFYDGAINDEMGPQGVAALRRAKAELRLGGPADVAGPTTLAQVEARARSRQVAGTASANTSHPWLQTLAKARLNGGPQSSCVATVLGNMDRLGIPSFSGGTTADPNNPRGAMVQMIRAGRWTSLALPGSQRRTISSPYGQAEAYVLNANAYERMARAGQIPSGAVLFQTRHGWGYGGGPYGNDMGIVRDGGRTTFNYAAMPPIVYGDAREVVVLVPRG